MNKIRRKRLDEAHSLLLQAVEIIREVQEEEQGAYDNMPEGLQESERGEQMQEYADSLGEIVDGVEEYCGTLDEIING